MVAVSGFGVGGLGDSGYASGKPRKVSNTPFLVMPDRLPHPADQQGAMETLPRCSLEFRVDVLFGSV